MYDDPLPKRTRPDTHRRVVGDGEDTRVDTVPAAQRFAEESSPSHALVVDVARELPLYPGIPQDSSRRDDPTVPDAPLGRGSPTAMQAAGQVSTTEHTSAPPSGTRNRGSAPELPPTPPPQPPAAPVVPVAPVARNRELERMLRLVTPLPTNEWMVAPNVHEWREEWGARHEVAEGAPAQRRGRMRFRTLLLVVLTLVAAAVIGTALGDAERLSRLVERATEFVRGTTPSHASSPRRSSPRLAAPPIRTPLSSKATARDTSEPPRRADVPAIPTVHVGDLPLAAPTDETGVTELSPATPKKPAAGRVIAKGATTRKTKPRARPGGH